MDSPDYIGPELGKYRLKRSLVQLHSLVNCPPQEFVRQQLSELAADLADKVDVVEAEAGIAQPLCSHCLTNVATRVTSSTYNIIIIISRWVTVPCGHWVGCAECCLRSV